MIQSGTIELSPTTIFGDGAMMPTGTWSLNAGSGDRSFRTPDLAFPQPFQQPPVVVLSLGGIDADAQFNTRLRLSAEDVQWERSDGRGNL